MTTEASELDMELYAARLWVDSPSSIAFCWFFRSGATRRERIDWCVNSVQGEEEVVQQPSKQLRLLRACKFPCEQPCTGRTDPWRMLQM